MCSMSKQTIVYKELKIKFKLNFLHDFKNLDSFSSQPSFIVFLISSAMVFVLYINLWNLYFFKNNLYSHEKQILLLFA